MPSTSIVSVPIQGEDANDGTVPVLFIYCEARLIEAVNLPDNYTINETQLCGTDIMHDNVKDWTGVDVNLLLLPGMAVAPDIDSSTPLSLISPVYRPLKFFYQPAGGLSPVRDRLSEGMGALLVQKEDKENRAKGKKPADPVTKEDKASMKEPDTMLAMIYSLREQVQELREEVKRLRENDERQQEKIDSQEEKIDSQQEEIHHLKEKAVRLEAENARLRAETNQLRQAAAGDKLALRDIRLRILLDLGRSHILKGCGYKKMYDFRQAFPNAEVENMDRLILRLKGQTKDFPARKLAVPGVLRAVLWPSDERDKGDEVAHWAEPSQVAEAIRLVEQKDRRAIMATIFEVAFPGKSLDVAGTSQV